MLESVADTVGGLKQLGCKIGKSYNAMSVYRANHKDDLAKITAYGVERAVELYEMTGEDKKYLATHNDAVIEFKITKQ